MSPSNRTLPFASTRNSTWPLIRRRDCTLEVPQVAVIGCGYWGKNLVRVFHSLHSLRAVCETTEQGKAISQQHARDIPVVEDYQDILTDDRVEAVVIATPAETHYRLASMALAAGKHVYVEKPLTLNCRDGIRLVRQARELGLLLMVGHILEFHPAILELRRRIEAGELGQIQYIYSNRLNLGKVRLEENILWSFAPHDIAVVLRLLGQMPVEVTATGAAYLQPNIADVTVTNLLFDRGVRAHIFVSWLHPYKEQKLVVVGSKRMAVFDDVVQQDKLTVYDQGIEWVNGSLVPRKGKGEVVALRTEEPLQAEAEHFLECLKVGENPLTDGESGLRVLQVLEAAQRSLSLHGQPVQPGMTRFDWEHVE